MLGCKEGTIRMQSSCMTHCLFYSRNSYGTIRLRNNQFPQMGSLLMTVLFVKSAGGGHIPNTLLIFLRCVIVWQGQKGVYPIHTFLMQLVPMFTFFCPAYPVMTHSLLSLLQTYQTFCSPWHSHNPLTICFRLYYHDYAHGNQKHCNICHEPPVTFFPLVGFLYSLYDFQYALLQWDAWVHDCLPSHLTAVWVTNNTWWAPVQRALSVYFRLNTLMYTQSLG